MKVTLWNSADEHYLLSLLRLSSDFIPELHYVAVVEGKVVGCIAYTKSSIKRGDKVTPTITFGPIGVLPDYRSRGIARKLINRTLDIAKEMGFLACIIYGDPRMYGRLGFRCAEKYDITNEKGEFAVSMMVMELQEGALREVERSGGGMFVESNAFAAANEADADEFDKPFQATNPKEKGPSDFQKEFRVMITMKYPRVNWNIGPCSRLFDLIHEHNF